MDTYIKTTDKTKAIKKALAATFGAANVSVRRGKGTASSWIHSYVSIPIPSDCSCELPGISWGEKMCSSCRSAYTKADDQADKISDEAASKAGGFSTYYSDDYSDSTARSCHLLQVRFIKS